MAPPPEQDKEPKAPDKIGISGNIDECKTLQNPSAEPFVNSDPSKPTSSFTNSESDDKKPVESLDDGQLRALLDEAITYKCPKDREGKSTLFKELLEKVERQDDQATTAASRGWGVRSARVKQGAKNRRGLPHSNSLQDLVDALAAERVHRNRGRHHTHHTSHHSQAPVSARTHHGGSLPSGVDTSFLLGEEEPVRCVEEPVRRGPTEYVATVLCVNPPPLSERRVSTSDAHSHMETEPLTRRSKTSPGPMTYTARATLEIGSNPGRAHTTTTASNQVRTHPLTNSHPPTTTTRYSADGQRRLLRALHTDSDTHGGGEQRIESAQRGPTNVLTDCQTDTITRELSEHVANKVAAKLERIDEGKEVESTIGKEDNASGGPKLTKHTKGTQDAEQTGSIDKNVTASVVIKDKNTVKVTIPEKQIKQNNDQRINHQSINIESTLSTQGGGEVCSMESTQRGPINIKQTVCENESDKSKHAVNNDAAAKLDRIDERKESRGQEEENTLGKEKDNASVKEKLIKVANERDKAEKTGLQNNNVPASVVNKDNGSVKVIVPEKHTKRKRKWQCYAQNINHQSIINKSTFRDNTFSHNNVSSNRTIENQTIKTQVRNPNIHSKPNSDIYSIKKDLPSTSYTPNKYANPTPSTSYNKEITTCSNSEKNNDKKRKKICTDKYNTKYEEEQEWKPSKSDLRKYENWYQTNEQVDTNPLRLVWLPETIVYPQNNINIVPVTKAWDNTKFQMNEPKNHIPKAIKKSVSIPHYPPLQIWAPDAIVHTENHKYIVSQSKYNSVVNRYQNRTNENNYQSHKKLKKTIERKPLTKEPPIVALKETPKVSAKAQTENINQIPTIDSDALTENIQETPSAGVKALTKTIKETSTLASKVQTEKIKETQTVDSKELTEKIKETQTVASKVQTEKIKETQTVDSKVQTENIKETQTVDSKVPTEKIKETQTVDSKVQSEKSLETSSVDSNAPIETHTVNVKALTEKVEETSTLGTTALTEKINEKPTVSVNPLPEKIIETPKVSSKEQTEKINETLTVFINALTEKMIETATLGVKALNEKTKETSILGSTALTEKINETSAVGDALTEKMIETPTVGSKELTEKINKTLTVVVNAITEKMIETPTFGVKALTEKIKERSTLSSTALTGKINETPAVSGALSEKMIETPTVGLNVLTEKINETLTVVVNALTEKMIETPTLDVKAPTEKTKETPKVGSEAQIEKTLETSSVGSNAPTGKIMETQTVNLKALTEKIKETSTLGSTALPEKIKETPAVSSNALTEKMKAIPSVVSIKLTEQQENLPKPKKHIPKAIHKLVYVPHNPPLQIWGPDAIVRSENHKHIVSQSKYSSVENKHENRTTENNYQGHKKLKKPKERKKLTNETPIVALKATPKESPKAQTKNIKQTPTMGSKAITEKIKETPSASVKTFSESLNETQTVGSKKLIEKTKETPKVGAEAQTEKTKETSSVGLNGPIEKIIETQTVNVKALTDKMKKTSKLGSTALTEKINETPTKGLNVQTEKMIETTTAGPKQLTEKINVTSTGSTALTEKINETPAVGDALSKKIIETPTVAPKQLTEKINETLTVVVNSLTQKMIETPTLGVKAPTEKTKETPKVASEAQIEKTLETSSVGSNAPTEKIMETQTVSVKALTEKIKEKSTLGSTALFEKINETPTVGLNVLTEKMIETPKVGSKELTEKVKETSTLGSTALTEKINETPAVGDTLSGKMIETPTVGPKELTEKINETLTVVVNSLTQKMIETPTLGVKAPTEKTKETPKVGSEAQIEKTLETSSVGSNAPTEKIMETQTVNVKALTEKIKETSTLGSTALPEKIKETPAVSSNALTEKMKAIPSVVSIKLTEQQENLPKPKKHIPKAIHKLVYVPHNPPLQLWGPDAIVRSENHKHIVSQSKYSSVGNKHENRTTENNYQGHKKLKKPKERKLLTKETPTVAFKATQKGSAKAQTENIKQTLTMGSEALTENIKETPSAAVKEQTENLQDLQTPTEKKKETPKVDAEAQTENPKETSSVGSIAPIENKIETQTVNVKALTEMMIETPTVDSKEPTEKIKGTQTVGSSAVAEKIKETQTVGVKAVTEKKKDTPTVNLEALTKNLKQALKVGSNALTEKIIETQTVSVKTLTEKMIETPTVGTKALSDKMIETQTLGSKALTDKMIKTQAVGVKALTEIQTVGSNALTEKIKDKPTVSSEELTENLKETPTMGSKVLIDKIMETQTVGVIALTEKIEETSTLSKTALTDKLKDTPTVASKALTEKIKETSTCGSTALTEKMNEKLTVVLNALAENMIKTPALGAKALNEKIKEPSILGSKVLTEKIKDTSTVGSKQLTENIKEAPTMGSKALTENIKETSTCGSTALTEKMNEKLTVVLNALAEKMIETPALGVKALNEKINETPTVSLNVLTEKMTDTPTVGSKELTEKIKETSTLGSTALTEKINETLTVVVNALTEKMIETPTLGVKALNEKIKEPSILGSKVLTEKIKDTSTVGSKQMTDNIKETPTVGSKALTEKIKPTQTVGSNALTQNIKETSIVGPTAPTEKLKKRPTGVSKAPNEKINETLTVVVNALTEKMIETPTLGVKALNEKIKEPSILGSKVLTKKIKDTSTVGSKQITDNIKETPTVGSKALTQNIKETSIVGTTAQTKKLKERPTGVSKAPTEKINETLTVAVNALTEKMIETPTLGVKSPTVKIKKPSILGSKVLTENIKDISTSGSTALIEKINGTPTVRVNPLPEKMTETRTMASKEVTEKINKTLTVFVNALTEKMIETPMLGVKSLTGKIKKPSILGSNVLTEKIKDTSKVGSKELTKNIKETPTAGSEALTEKMIETQTVGVKALTEKVEDSSTLGSTALTETLKETPSVVSKKLTENINETPTVGIKAQPEKMIETVTVGSKELTENIKKTHRLTDDLKALTEKIKETPTVGSKELTEKIIENELTGTFSTEPSDRNRKQIVSPSKRTTEVNIYQHYQDKLLSAIERKHLTEETPVVESLIKHELSEYYPTGPPDETNVVSKSKNTLEVNRYQNLTNQNRSQNYEKLISAIERNYMARKSPNIGCSSKELPEKRIKSELSKSYSTGPPDRLFTPNNQNRRAHTSPIPDKNDPFLQHYYQNGVYKPPSFNFVTKHETKARNNLDNNNSATIIDKKVITDENNGIELTKNVKTNYFGVYRSIIPTSIANNHQNDDTEIVQTHNADNINSTNASVLKDNKALIIDSGVNKNNDTMANDNITSYQFIAVIESIARKTDELKVSDKVELDVAESINESLENVDTEQSACSVIPNVCENNTIKNQLDKKLVSESLHDNIEVEFDNAKETELFEIKEIKTFSENAVVYSEFDSVITDEVCQKVEEISTVRDVVEFYKCEKLEDNVYGTENNSVKVKDVECGINNGENVREVDIDAAILEKCVREVVIDNEPVVSSEMTLEQFGDYVCHTDNNSETLKDLECGINNDQKVREVDIDAVFSENCVREVVIDNGPVVSGGTTLEQFEDNVFGTENSLEKVKDLDCDMNNSENVHEVEEAILENCASNVAIDFEQVVSCDITLEQSEDNVCGPEKNAENLKNPNCDMNSSVKVHEADIDAAILENCASEVVIDNKSVVSNEMTLEHLEENVSGTENNSEMVKEQDCGMNNSEKVHDVKEAILENCTSKVVIDFEQVASCDITLDKLEDNDCGTENSAENLKNPIFDMNNSVKIDEVDINVVILEDWANDVVIDAEQVVSSDIHFEPLVVGEPLGSKFSLDLPPNKAQESKKVEGENYNEKRELLDYRNSKIKTDSTETSKKYFNAQTEFLNMIKSETNEIRLAVIEEESHSLNEDCIELVTFNKDTNTAEIRKISNQAIINPTSEVEEIATQVPLQSVQDTNNAIVICNILNTIENDTTDVDNRTTVKNGKGKKKKRNNHEAKTRTVEEHCNVSLTLRMLLFEKLFKHNYDDSKIDEIPDKVDSGIPFSCITTPEVVTSSSTSAGASTQQTTNALDSKPLQLSSEYCAVASLTGAMIESVSLTRWKPRRAPTTTTTPTETRRNAQPRNTIATTFNGLPLSRPNYSSTATSSTDEFKKSTDENGNSMQGLNTSSSSSSHNKKPRRKKSSKNETVIKSDLIDGYQGNKDLNELLKFIESNEDNNRSQKLGRVHAKHKDDTDERTKKRPTERRRDKERVKRASSLEEVSRTTIEELTTPRRTRAPADSQRRSWGDDYRVPSTPNTPKTPANTPSSDKKKNKQTQIEREPGDVANELTEFQTVTKRKKQRKRGGESAVPPPAARRATPSPRRKSAPPSDRSGDSTDDMESVHSLPARPATTTAPASYADIARTRNIPDLIESCNYYSEDGTECVVSPPEEEYPALCPPRAPPPPTPPAPPDVVVRPAVILRDEPKSAELDGVTFGFDINEQLLKTATTRRCDLVRESAVNVLAGLRYLPPPSPPTGLTTDLIVDYVGHAWEDIIKCGSGKVRYFSE